MNEYRQQHDEEDDVYNEDMMAPSHSTTSLGQHPHFHPPDTGIGIVASQSMLTHNYSFHHVPSSTFITKTGSSLSNRHHSTLNPHTLNHLQQVNGAPNNTQGPTTPAAPLAEAEALPITPFTMAFMAFYILILGFFLLFTSYSLVQNLSVSLFGASTGSITIGIVYIFFIFSALLAPVMLTTKEIFNNDGLFMMFIGSISYTLLTIACCFNSFPLLIIGAILVGLSAGLVWVGYSTTLNAYARIYAERIWYDNEIALHSQARTEFFMNEHLARDPNPKSSQLTEDLFVSRSLKIRKGKLDSSRGSVDQGDDTDTVLDDNLSVLSNNPKTTTTTTIQQSGPNNDQGTLNLPTQPNPLLTPDFDPTKSLQYTNSLILPNSRVAVNILQPHQTAVIDATTKQILGLLNAIAWAFLNLDVVFGGLFSYFILSESKKAPEPTPTPDDESTTPSEPFVSMLLSLLSGGPSTPEVTPSPNLISVLSGGGGDVPTDVNPRPLFIFLACASAVANLLYFLAFIKSPKALYDLPPSGDEENHQLKAVGEECSGIGEVSGPEKSLQEFPNLEDIKLPVGADSSETYPDTTIHHTQSDESNPASGSTNPLFIVSRAVTLIYHCLFQNVFLLSLPSWFAIAVPISFIYTLFTAYYVKPVLGTENIPLIMIVVAAVDSFTSILVSKLLSSLRWARIMGIFGSCLQLIMVILTIVVFDPKTDTTTQAWVKSILIAALCGFGDAFSQIPTNAAIGMIVDSAGGSREVNGACFGLSTVIKSGGSIFIFLSGKFIGFATQQWCIVVIVSVSVVFQVINMMREKPIDVEHLQHKYDHFAFGTQR